MNKLHVKPGGVLYGVITVITLVAASIVGPGLSHAAPSFVQVVAATPQTSQATVTVKYTKAQAAGDANVLAIGWDDATSTISSVTDTMGNPYSVAAPTVRGSGTSQAVYYAKNIVAAAANANTVTVTFNQSAPYVDLRASEYGGLDTVSPVDKTASASGTSSNAATAAATTTYSNELIFGAGNTKGNFTAAGTGFTKRIITSPDSDITEDRTVTAIGAYTASAKVTGGAWVMQMVTFKAAGATPDTTAPSVPTGLAGNPVSQNQINVTWNASTDNVGVTGYKLYRNGTQVGTPLGTSFSDTGLSPATTYAYTVASFDAAGNTSAQTIAVNVTTQAPDTTPPSVPSGLTATAVSTSQINLSWSTSTDNIGVVSYKLYRDGTLLTQLAGTSYNNTGLQAGTTYSYAVGAVDAAGNESDQSLATQATTQAPDTTPPSVPSGLAGSPVSQNQINLTWNASTDNVGVVSYKLYRDGTLLTQLAGTTYNNTGLQAGTTYSYTVSAVDAAGNNSVQSTAVNVTTQAPDTTPPSVPAGITVGNATTTALTVSWGTSTDDVAVTGYKVYRGGTQVGSSASTSYTDTGLAANTTYNYTVSAYDAAGNGSAQSAVASGTTLTGPSFPFLSGVSANHRYLLDQNNQPYLIVGDSPHSLIVNRTEAEMDAYFANRQAHGINAAWVEALDYPYTGGRTDASTYDGIVPFTTPNDFSTPNPAYFQRLKDAVNIAAQHGVTVFLTPVDTAGWQSAYEANGQTKNYNYGVFLGNLLKDAPNVVWMHGNDYGMWYAQADDADIMAIAQGIKSVDSNHLHTLELNATFSSSLDDQNWANIINFNGAYTYYATYDGVLRAYNQTPQMPTFMEEANYEFENLAGPDTTSETLRRQQYWTVLSGGLAGQIYGNMYTWRDVTWSDEQAHLDTPAAAQLGYAKSFFTSRPWYNLVPDTAHSFLTAGYGTYTSATVDVLDSDYATAAVTPDGALGMVYVPTARTVTVDLNKMAGTVTARWYDPSNNTFTNITGSPFAASSGSKQFTTPGANHDGNGDWVLVLEGNFTPDPTPPSMPTGLTVTGTTGTTASTAWTASTDNVSVAGYKIYRDGNLVGNTSSTSFTDTNLSANTTYTYTVAAYDFAGNVSTPSAPQTATTTNQVPLGTPKFVQQNYATPQTSQTKVTVPYSVAQTNGNLNIVAVGWSMTNATVSSVTDSAGNVYQLAAPVTHSGQQYQAIYYAKNIKPAAAGGNIVTVNFSTGVQYADVRIAEYSGLDQAAPFDAAASGTGNSSTATTASLTTTKPVELLFAAGSTAGSFTGAGSGYTLRVITSPDSDIVEDRLVNATGSYTATAPNSGDYVMQVVAFKAAGQ